MRVYLDFDYNFRCVVELAAAELDVLNKVLDRVQLCDNWYGHGDEIKRQASNSSATYSAKLLPARVAVRQAPVEAPVEA
jgi:hypothetical protein